MSYDLLFLESIPTSIGPRDREALGIPGTYRPVETAWALRFERLPNRTAEILADSARRCRGTALLFGKSGARNLFLGLSAAAWPSFRRRLSRAGPPLSGIAEEIASTRRHLLRPAPQLLLARRSLRLGRRTTIQGILNVTPDSFHDGGRWTDPAQAAERAARMEAEGAGIIDVGGESTRPGSRSLSAREELKRVLPVIERLSGRLKVPISVDTSKAEVAEAALAAGAEIINDISGLTFDPKIARVAARHRAAIILSHIRGRPRTMQRSPHYHHLLPEVLGFLRNAVHRALQAGIDPKSIVIDPGIGFGKTGLHNLLLLRHLRCLTGIGYPVLVGASRKSFVGKILGEGSDQRLEGSLAAAVVSVFHGASVLRVHDVAATIRVARLAEAIRDAGSAPRGGHDL